MAPQLNERVQRELYEEFYGKNTEQMPRLMADDRLPMSVNGLMQRRSEVLELSDAVKEAYWDNYFDTGDAIAYHPNGNVKIVYDSQLLREMTPESELMDGALVLEDGLYERLEGPEFTREDIEKYQRRSLTQDEVNDNPFWQVLARSSELLQAYSQEVFSQAKERFGRNKNMGLYFASAEEVPVMQLWTVSGISVGSVADCDYGLGDDYGGRLVGVAPEALREVQE